MRRHYTKNAYSPVNRTQHIEARGAEREIFPETKQKLPPGLREKKGLKCDECGIVLKENKKMLRIYLAALLCMGCYAEQDDKNSRRVKNRRTYKRFMEQYGKEWSRRTLQTYCKKG